MTFVLTSVAVGIAATPALAQVEYRHDDGRGNSLGPSFDEWDMVFLNAFDTQPEGRWLTSVQVCWGSARAGIPADILIMDDPDGDGSANTARLRATLPASTVPAGNNIFQTYALDTPVRVCGRFYVGARVRLASEARGVYPARIDPESAAVADHAYLFVGSNITPEYFLDLENLGQAPVAYRMDNHAFRGTWLVRATGAATPGHAECAADFNDDNFLDFFDYESFVRCFETADCPPCKSADINADDFIDFFDYADFVTMFDQGC